MLATLLTVVAVSCASPVFAQSVDPGDRTAFLSSVSSTTTTSVVGGVIITVTIAQGTASLERYLRHNAVAARHDITRGAGPIVGDLADAFGVVQVHLPKFGRLLRARRAMLLGLIADDVLSDVSAARFAALVLADVEQAGLTGL